MSENPAESPADETAAPTASESGHAATAAAETVTATSQPGAASAPPDVVSSQAKDNEPYVTNATSILAHDDSGAERLAEDSSATAVLSPDGSVVAAMPAHKIEHPSLKKIFLVFLYIGAISFGGGVVAYLRNDLVKANHWLDDESFVELLAISQTLPGLNATNMAVLVGDRLAGPTGGTVALIGMCLPGFCMMLATGFLYTYLRHNPLINAILHSVAGAAVGLVLATTLQLSKKSVKTPWDWVIVVLCVIGINGLKQTVPIVLLVVGILAIIPHRPKSKKDQPA